MAIAQQDLNSGWRKRCPGENMGTELKPPLTLAPRPFLLVGPSFQTEAEGLELARYRAGKWYTPEGDVFAVIEIAGPLSIDIPTATYGPFHLVRPVERGLFSGVSQDKFLACMDERNDEWVFFSPWTSNPLVTIKPF